MSYDASARFNSLYDTKDIFSNTSANDTALNSYYKSLVGAESSLLGQRQLQKDVNQILSLEKTRMEGRLNQIKGEYQTTERIMQTQDADSFRMQSYTKMLLAVIIASIVIIILKTLSLNIPGLSGFMNLIVIAVVAAAVIYCGYVYMDVASRLRVDHTRLDIPPPPRKKSGEEQAEEARKARDAGNLLGAITGEGSCQGATCCSDDTVYVTSQDKCIPRIFTNTNNIKTVYDKDGTIYNTVDKKWVKELASEQTATMKQCGNSFIQNSTQCNEAFTTNPRTTSSNSNANPSVMPYFSGDLRYSAY